MTEAQEDDGERGRPLAGLVPTRGREKLGEGATSARGDAAGLKRARKERGRVEEEEEGRGRGLRVRGRAAEKENSPGVREIEEPGRARRGGERNFSYKI